MPILADDRAGVAVDSQTTSVASARGDGGGTDQPDVPVGPSPATGAALADRLHARCVVCSQRNPRGLGLCFRPAADGGGVTAEFPCDADFQGYDGLIHGGVVSMLLDGAMAHCLFHQGRVGHTGELVVRFRQGVLVGHPATVLARLVRSKGRMHELSAALRQDGVVKAEATARFMETGRSGRVGDARG
jgi:acyl-coenzyme A thioesterase PaaI-like protein